MGFLNELVSSPAVQAATGALVTSGETYFREQTGISLSQPLPPAGDSSFATSTTSAEPSDTALDAPRTTAAPAAAGIPTWVWYVGGALLLLGAAYAMRK